MLTPLQFLLVLVTGDWTLTGSELFKIWVLGIMSPFLWLVKTKVIMEGKLFQRCTHILYCSVLSLGGNVNTRRMSKPDMGSIFYIQNQWNILVIGNYNVNYNNYQNLMLLISSDTKRTLMHLFLFTNSAQRELISKCTHSIRNCNYIITFD